MKKRVPLLFLVGCAALLAFGMIRLFQARLESGDVYPRYSSLRSDPMGTMVLYESLELVPGIAVSRDFSATGRLPEGNETTYLHLAALRRDWVSLSETDLVEVERFLARGGRLVIAMAPVAANLRRFRNSEVEQVGKENDGNETKPKSPSDKTQKDGEDPKHPQDLRDDEFEPARDLRSRWGLGFALIDLDETGGHFYEPVRVENRSDRTLPPALLWHSGIVLSNLHSGWNVIYARGTNAVVVERQFGRGSVVVATDSYFLSNEAMESDRHPDLLSWLLGKNERIVFDEAHLGIIESPGIATLLRQYRLHWLIGAVVVLAGLFVWKNSASLLPPYPESETAEVVAGRDATAGFINLLRRSVHPRDLIATCFVEWRKSAGQTGMFARPRLTEAEAVFESEMSLPQRERDQIRVYRRIAAVLQTRKTEFSQGKSQ